MNEVVDTPAGFTPSFVTAALNSTGHHVTVDEVSATRIGTGQMGATYRLRLAGRGRGMPASLIAKIAGDNLEMRPLVAPGYAAEVGFYREVASAVDVTTPRCWYAAIVEDHTSFTLLLDDLESATVSVQAVGCTVDQARLALDNLARLHAPRWDDPALASLGFLGRPTPDTAALMHAAFGGAASVFIERYSEQLTDDDVATLGQVAEVLDTWQLSGLDHLTVVHGDYRLDNLLFLPASVSVVDWQTAAVGPGTRDVAYFLGNSLQTTDRRAAEALLVAEYHAALVEHGVDSLSFDECWTGYRRGHLHGPMIAIIGCVYASGPRSASSDEMFLAMVRRSCAAIRDLDSFSLVGP